MNTYNVTHTSKELGVRTALEVPERQIDFVNNTFRYNDRITCQILEIEKVDSKYVAAKLADCKRYGCE